jgi:hypothetical protein
MSPTLQRRLYVDIHCIHCDHVMHVDLHEDNARLRIVMCENPACEEFGFAWTFDMLSGIATSDRPEPESEAEVKT